MILTQYEITHMENLMVRDDYWESRCKNDDEWDEEDEFQEDEIDEF